MVYQKYIKVVIQNQEESAFFICISKIADIYYTFYKIYRKSNSSIYPNIKYIIVFDTPLLNNVEHFSRNIENILKINIDEVIFIHNDLVHDCIHHKFFKIRQPRTMVRFEQLNQNEHTEVRISEF